MQLRKATRKQAKLRIGISAPSGFGKTYSALLTAFGITGDWEKIAVIDTENGSGELYSHLGDYNALPLEAPYSPERYIEAIKTCEGAGMEVIIIDSISHEWEGVGGVLEMADSIGGGFQSAWKVLTPRHEKFKQAILTSKCHIITTARRKQDYILQETTNRQGKTVQSPVKAGFKEVTREGWEYELTVNLEIVNANHYAKASKDRTELFAGKPEFVITIETGQKLKEWAETGVDAAKLETEAQEQAQALALELDEKKAELTSLVDANLTCFGPEESTMSKKAIAAMSLDKYQDFHAKITNKIQQCEIDKQSLSAELNELVTLNSETIGDDLVGHYLKVAETGTLPQLRETLTKVREILTVTA